MVILLMLWGLDDYHFLPFFKLFGSAQLRTSAGPTNRRVPGHPSPKAIHVPEIVDELERDHMYFECIKFINSVSTFSLYSISTHGICEVFRSRRHRFDSTRPCSTTYPLYVPLPSYTIRSSLTWGGYDLSRLTNVEGQLNLGGE